MAIPRLLDLLLICDRLGDAIVTSDAENAKERCAADWFGVEGGSGEEEKGDE
jgi:hypothetical protein